MVGQSWSGVERIYAWFCDFAAPESLEAFGESVIEVGHDPQLRANGYIQAVVDVEGNERELVADPVQFDNTPPTLTRAPQFAEHTDEILAELGLDQDRIIELKIAGAVT